MQSHVLYLAHSYKQSKILRALSPELSDQWLRNPIAAKVTEPPRSEIQQNIFSLLIYFFCIFCKNFLFQCDFCDFLFFSFSNFFFFFFSIGFDFIAIVLSFVNEVRKYKCVYFYEMYESFTSILNCLC